MRCAVYYVVHENHHAQRAIVKWQKVGTNFQTRNLFVSQGLACEHFVAGRDHTTCAPPCGSTLSRTRLDCQEFALDKRPCVIVVELT